MNRTDSISTKTSPHHYFPPPCLTVGNWYLRLNLSPVGRRIYLIPSETEIMNLDSSLPKTFEHCFGVQFKFLLQAFFGLSKPMVPLLVVGQTISHVEVVLSILQQNTSHYNSSLFSYSIRHHSSFDYRDIISPTVYLLFLLLSLALSWFVLSTSCFTIFL